MFKKECMKLTLQLVCYIRIRHEKYIRLKIVAGLKGMFTNYYTTTGFVKIVSFLKSHLKLLVKSSKNIFKSPVNTFTHK